jgi:hypothetical protein
LARFVQNLRGNPISSRRKDTGAMTTPTTGWMPELDTDYQRLKGMMVLSRDSDQLGTIRAIIHPDHSATTGEGGHFFLFEPGPLRSWFGGLDEAYLPESAILNVTDEGVLIDLTEAEIRQRRWDLPTTVGYSRS